MAVPHSLGLFLAEFFSIMDHCLTQNLSLLLIICLTPLIQEAPRRQGFLFDQYWAPLPGTYKDLNNQLLHESKFSFHPYINPQGCTRSPMLPRHLLL